MGVDRLRAFLEVHPRVGLDSSVFVYQLDANVRYLALTDRIFSWLVEPGSQAITSTVTMTELLVPGYRLSDRARVRQVYGLFSTYPNLEWIAPGLEIADLAARLRGIHRLRTPDAIQAATAIHAKTTGFITNDPVFRRVENFEALILDDLP